MTEQESLKQSILYDRWVDYADNLIKSGCLIESIKAEAILGVTTITYKKKRKGELHPTIEKVENDRLTGLQTFIFAKEEAER